MASSFCVFKSVIVLLILGASHIVKSCGPDPGGCANLSSFCNRVSYIRQYCKVTCNVCIATQPTAVPPTTTITITTTTATTATTPVPPSAQEACIDKDSDCSRWKQHCKASGWMQRNCKVTCSLCGSGAWSQCTKTCGTGTRYKETCGANNICLYEFEECATNECPPKTCFSPTESYRYGIRHSCCKNEPYQKGTCGTTFLNSNVVGGQDANVKRWPWMVWMNGVPSSLDSNNQPVDTKGAVLTLKILKLEELNSKGVKRKIKEAIIHPEYKFPVHDIAILKMDKRVNFNSRIQPVCLPGGEITPMDTSCYVTGWGISENSGLSATSHLQEAAIQTLDRRICRTKYRNTGFAQLLNNDQGYLCAGSLTKSIDSCAGDSGGPLLCQRCSSCKWYVAGIVSFGHIRCGTKGVPAVYTEVRAYEEWISKVTKVKHPIRSCPYKYGP